jgi:hypothetical protein
LLAASGRGGGIGGGEDEDDVVVEEGKNARQATSRGFPGEHEWSHETRGLNYCIFLAKKGSQPIITASYPAALTGRDISGKAVAHF